MYVSCLVIQKTYQLQQPFRCEQIVMELLIQHTSDIMQLPLDLVLGILKPRLLIIVFVQHCLENFLTTPQPRPTYDEKVMPCLMDSFFIVLILIPILEGIGLPTFHMSLVVTSIVPIFISNFFQFLTQIANLLFSNAFVQLISSNYLFLSYQEESKTM
jgi:hypothetical protein